MGVGGGVSVGGMGVAVAVGLGSEVGVAVGLGGEVGVEVRVAEGEISWEATTAWGCPCRLR